MEEVDLDEMIKVGLHQILRGNGYGAKLVSGREEMLLSADKLSVAVRFVFVQRRQIAS